MSLHEPIITILCDYLPKCDMIIDNLNHRLFNEKGYKVIREDLMVALEKLSDHKTIVFNRISPTWIYNIRLTKKGKKLAKKFWLRDFSINPHLLNDDVFHLAEARKTTILRDALEEAGADSSILELCRNMVKREWLMEWIRNKKKQEVNCEQ